jgi:predicted component of type VI protein secretion system
LGKPNIFAIAALSVNAVIGEIAMANISKYETRLQDRASHQKVIRRSKRALCCRATARAEPKNTPFVA